MRDRALGVLTARLLELAGRAKRRELTRLERGELEQVTRVIETLQRMGAGADG